jgi:tetratricopeptide (TPR) repeat protein/GGDEF domain-containing protein
MMANTHAKGASEQTMLINQVQQLLKVNSEMIDSDTVKYLAKEVTDNRQQYSKDILAKVFLLSAWVASNEGDINNVFLFAEQGLAVNSLDKTVKLSLLLKLAEVYLAKKEYKKLLKLTQQAVNSSELSFTVKYALLSLSYRSVAFAILGDHRQALAGLQQVEREISNSELTEHIELLTILALAYHHLGDYQTSLTMQLKILKLRFEIGQKNNIAQTYLYLGYAYFNLQRFDDAYNAFWASKKYAQSNKAPINVAHANKGLGIVLIKQQQFYDAVIPLEQAIKIFQQKSMFAQHVESKVALVKAKLGSNRQSEGYALLSGVLKLLDGEDISIEYFGFYRMVAEMNLAQKDHLIAYQWQEKYSQALLDKLNYKKKSASFVQSLSYQSLGATAKTESIEESKKLALKLAENSELSSSFVSKYQKQRMAIISLSALVCLLVLTLLGFFLRLRAQRINLAYEEVEKPSYAMAAPIQTKFDYQLSFKKSRKYQYPLVVGYLIIDNWQELSFRFNNKSINEVKRDIASVINEQLTEFDYAGLLNKGEYLLLFEHQNTDEVKAKLDKLVQAVNARAFTSLGDFSITMKYSLNRPDFQDIDPYLFLARIVESVNIEQVTNPKVS